MTDSKGMMPLTTVDGRKRPVGESNAGRAMTLNPTHRMRRSKSRRKNNRRSVSRSNRLPVSNPMVMVRMTSGGKRGIVVLAYRWRKAQRRPSPLIRERNCRCGYRAERAHERKISNACRASMTIKPPPNHFPKDSSACDLFFPISSFICQSSSA